MDNNEIIKIPHYRPFVRESTGDYGFPLQFKGEWCRELYRVTLPVGHHAFSSIPQEFYTLFNPSSSQQGLVIICPWKYEMKLLIHSETYKDAQLKFGNEWIISLWWHRLILIVAWISNHMPSKVSDEITHPFPNFNGCTVEVWKWVSNFIPHFTTDVITYPWWY